MAWDVKVRVYIFLKRLGDRIGLDLPYFVKNGFWVALKQIIGTSSGLLLVVVFARLASQEVYGQYQFVLSILAVISVLSVPGLNASIVKSAAEGKDGDYQDAVKISFLWSLLGIPLLMAVGGYFYGIRQEYIIGISLMIASIFFPFLYAPNTWDSFLQGKGRFDISVLYGSMQMVLNTLCMIGVVYFYSNSTVAIVVVYLFSYTFFNVYYYLRSLRYVENEEKDGDMIRYGWFLTKVNVLWMISGNADKILVGLYLGPAQLAIYSIGVFFARQIQNVSKNFLWVLIPKQICQKSVSRSNYGRVFLLSVLVTSIAIVSFEYVVPLFFSHRYDDSIGLSIISMAFYPVFIIATLYRNQVVFNKKEATLKREAIISPLIMLALMTIVIPMYGVTGLAFLFGFQYAVALAVLYALKNMTLKKNEA